MQRRTRASRSSYVVDAVRKHMRVLLTPSDDADLHALSETARAIEANLGEACAREYMENTLMAAYGSGRFFCTVCAQTRAPRGPGHCAALRRRARVALAFRRRR
jgi:hypothetical protein